MTGEGPRTTNHLVLQAGAAAYERLRPRRIALLDLEVLDQNPHRGDLENSVRAIVGEAATSDLKDRFRYVWKAAVASLMRNVEWQPPQDQPVGISAQPPSDETIRRCMRVIAAVHELHKAGYQRLRISPGVSPSGAHWRCNVTYASNIAEDGFSIIDFDIERGTVAPHTSANDARYFGWDDAEALDARGIARRLLERFPLIAERGVGQDWLYAGWLTSILGRAEHGRLPILYADWELDPAEIRLIQPPPPPS